MVIDTNNSINSGGTTGTRGKGTSAVSPTTSKTPAAPTETRDSKGNVVLSEEAQRLNRLQANISSSPDVDVERVAALKLAIASGRFEINAERIAENLLKQDDLLG